MQGDTSFLIRSFVNHIEQHRVNALELKCFLAGGAPVDEHEPADWQESRNDLYRTQDSIAELAPRLARILEADGLDSSDVLRVAHVIESAHDNMATLDRFWGDWPELRVRLERLALQAETPAVKHAPDLTDGDSQYFPAKYYQNFNISADTLRKAAHDGRVKYRKGNGNRNEYADADARRCWPHLFQV